MLCSYSGAVEPRMAALMESSLGIDETDVVNGRLNADERRISTQL